MSEEATPVRLLTLDGVLAQACFHATRADRRRLFRVGPSIALPSRAEQTLLARASIERNDRATLVLAQG